MQPSATTETHGSDTGGAIVRRHPNPWQVAFVTLLTVGVFAVVTWVLLGSRLLVVREVAVSGVSRIDAPEVVAAVDVATGTPLARVDTSAAAGRVERLRLVESAQVSRGWPATLRVRVTERRPVLSIDVGGGYRLVDHDGVRVADAEQRPQKYPLVQITGEAKGNPAIAATAAVVEGLPPAILGEVATIRATDREQLTLELASGATVLWGDDTHIQSKARALEILLRHHTPEAGRHYDVSTPEVAVVK
ncbi:cell division protein FtsQ/DivIB [Salinactinospora qingdaonensis]|uniref:POTRA domain-containing protein n=1 Tax=Salinactinospora qingdaonensis TaxID=702744 RepID=A0ABP7FLT2_9ACTN